MTILDALQGINAYPIPLRALTEIAGRRGIALNMEVTQEVQEQKPYNLCVADVMIWLTFAPNVSQGGQAYSFTDEQRLRLRARANALYTLFDEEASITGTKFGYKGSRL